MSKREVLWLLTLKRVLRRPVLIKMKEKLIGNVASFANQTKQRIFTPIIIASLDWW